MVCLSCAKLLEEKACLHAAVGTGKHRISIHVRWLHAAANASSDDFAEKLSLLDYSRETPITRLEYKAPYTVVSVCFQSVILMTHQWPHLLGHVIRNMPLISARKTVTDFWHLSFYVVQYLTAAFAFIICLVIRLSVFCQLDYKHRPH